MKLPLSPEPASLPDPEIGPQARFAGTSPSLTDWGKWCESVERKPKTEEELRAEDQARRDLERIQSHFSHADAIEKP